MMKKYPMKLRPVSKEILWGGKRLKERYNKTAPFDKLAESWELTVRDDGMSVIDAHYAVSRLLGHERADVTDIYLASVRKRGRDGE